ncbi:head GIN domain-containing protein [Aquimarina sp. 2201CG5-10]|uniref:head GIN domain-containing protein n=1 Tax=Aquimarina callyspongiae TaxID=3098150 RepID=UPI002AB59CE9|nr:head GIN domain-containing protein [Aquimarina sp. 2201CG5-10]MDY8136269.1 head GIN domain-containing protein [Aquimarina sp. 2201CG5-10]
MRTVAIILCLAVCSITSLQAQWWGNGKKIQGDGNMVTKNRNISDYDEIKVKGSLDVSLISGTEGNIMIEGENNLIEYIMTEVEGDALKIYVKKGYYLKPSRGKKLVITVPFKDVSAVTLSGSGDIYSTDTIKASDFKTGVSGSGDVTLVVDAQNTWGQVSGSGDLVLSGSSENFQGKVSGSGDLQAFDLKAKSVTAAVAGSGDVEVTATYSLKARVSGSGDIYYRGNPEKEDKSVSGSGDITKK